LRVRLRLGMRRQAYGGDAAEEDGQDAAWLHGRFSAFLIDEAVRWRSGRCVHIDFL
jgi:hypothetical protein